jgi:putative acetyltransferase
MLGLLVTNERIERRTRQIEENFDQAIVLVAEDKEGIVGFGEVVSKSRELRAVYVSPKAGRKGVNSAILAELKKAARNNDIDELWLDSSITAEPFYLAHGWNVTERGEHVLNNGARMACVKMCKKL